MPAGRSWKGAVTPLLKRPEIKPFTAMGSVAVPVAPLAKLLKPDIPPATEIKGVVLPTAVLLKPEILPFELNAGKAPTAPVAELLKPETLVPTVLKPE